MSVILVMVGEKVKSKEEDGRHTPAPNALLGRPQSTDRVDRVKVWWAMEE